MILIIKKENINIKELNVNILPSIGDNIDIPDLGMVAVIKKNFAIHKKISKINSCDEMVCIIEVKKI